MGKLDGKRILLVGDVSLDWVYSCSAREQKDPTFVISGEPRHQAGLSGAVGIRLAAAGAQVKLCSITADDQDGFDLYDILDEADLVQVERYVCRLRTLDRTLVRNKYISKDLEFFTHSEYPRIVFDRYLFDREVIKEARSWPDLIIIQDFGYGVVSQALRDELVHCASVREKPVFMNAWEGFSLEGL
jgi:bifunctional ADP-heptose synthase (sugar kinase/adenylyltransferase)